ncbi:MAG TPA: phosphate signaling complex protein PhoU [Phycisphaerales bacterium]|nr:phosphate signaling complex protein PhoU [Phycisphaerales bacterium]
MLQPSDDQPLLGAPRASGHEVVIERELRNLRGMILAEAATAIGMVEQAAEALVALDDNAARIVIGRDDEIDREEVRIEEECFRILALFHPFAKDFRLITTFVKINNDIERVADHATSVAKQTIKLQKLGVRSIPTALNELAQRVPMLCRGVLNSLASEDAADARELAAKDKAIDSLEKQLFEECVNIMADARDSKAAGLIMHRCGRELERVGDLMKNIAEDLIYLQSGTIVRHEKKLMQQ